MNTTIIIDADVMMKLTDENQEKVVQIYHIADILRFHHQPPMTWEDFVGLYDAPLSTLEAHTNAKAEKYNVPAPDLRIRPNEPRQQHREYPHDCD